MSRSIPICLFANLVVAALAASITLPAAAQQSVDVKSRADVQKETLAAARAHALIPAGEAELPAPPPSPGTVVTRRQVKAETAQAAKDGTLLPAGEGTDRQVSRQGATVSSSRTRAEVIGETRSAARAHELIPAGEGWYPTPYR